MKMNEIELDEFSDVGMRRLAKLFKGLHMIDVAIRKNGKTEYHEADWLKGLWIVMDHYISCKAKR